MGRLWSGAESRLAAGTVHTLAVWTAQPSTGGRGSTAYRSSSDGIGRSLPLVCRLWSDGSYRSWSDDLYVARHSLKVIAHFIRVQLIEKYRASSDGVGCCRACSDDGRRIDIVLEAMDASIGRVRGEFYRWVVPPAMGVGGLKED